ncbi:hypothetical protein [Salinarimonas sp.]|uniref:hypothetical protein n=1 Tax=Salinarimonas sp. TaxID=2766526 RepID=UPI00391AFFB1
MLMTLINHPTPSFSLIPHGAPQERIILGNVYRNTMPVSLARVAAIIESTTDHHVQIVDLRAQDSEYEFEYKTVDLGDRYVLIKRVGAPFEFARQAIENSDLVGFSNHFTYESGIVRDLISYCREVKPEIKIIVGGADAKVRPQFYIGCGANLVFRGDVNPSEFSNNDWTTPRVVNEHRHSFEDIAKPAFNKLEPLDRYINSHDGPVPKGVSTPVGFIYFTRGCPRECDFCESRRTKFESMNFELALSMIDHYERHGIKTLNFSDDNLLLLKRDYIEKLFSILYERGFAWEFPNGLEIGRFAKGDEIDYGMIRALFQSNYDERKGTHVGAYRLFVPLESFEHRDKYKKLKSQEITNRIINAILGQGLREINFGVVLGPDATEDSFISIEKGYKEIKAIVGRYHTKARYSIFHLIPIAFFRGMKTNFHVDEFPEGWNFYFPIYDGHSLTAMQLFDRRLAAVRSIDPAVTFGMKTGTYSYA